MAKKYFILFFMNFYLFILFITIPDKLNFKFNFFQNKSKNFYSMHSIYFITTKFHIFLKIFSNYQIIRIIFIRNQTTKNILELVIF